MATTATITLSEISDAELRRRLSVMRPLARDGEGQLRLIAIPDPRSVSFIWNPKLLAPISESQLVEVERIETLHSCGHPLLFKPSLAEVLDCVPEELIGQAFYFETLSGEAEAVEADGRYLHRAETVLYARR